MQALTILIVDIVRCIKLRFDLSIILLSWLVLNKFNE